VNGIDRRIKARRTTHLAMQVAEGFKGRSIGDRSNLGPAQMGHSLVTVSYPFRDPFDLTCPQLDSSMQFDLSPIGLRWLQT
jgi:hypothetical protein